MRGAKPWQLIVIVASVLAMAGSVLYTCSQVPDTSSSTSMYLVDLNTGDLFEAAMPKNRPIMLPARHPVSGEENLFPALNKEGRWFVENRYLPYAMQGPDGKVRTALPGLADPKTGEIKPSTGTPAKADIFK
ncbi:MAG: hypothetical protein JNK25_15075 [Phycisphaerae bacterium]|nr:hypothetical protein [Phycisphaerae bacterium]